MAENEVYVVLTENKYLFSGISSLLQDKMCILMSFQESRVLKELENTKNITLVIDCLILLQGVWVAFNTILAYRPDSTVVWLTRSETGRIFPRGREGDYILEQKMNPVLLRFFLKNVSHSSKNKEISSRVKPISLTKMERKFFPSFILGLTVPFLSKMHRKPNNQLYRLRQNILIKMGFRSFCFLQLIYYKNNNLY